MDEIEAISGPAEVQPEPLTKPSALEPGEKDQDNDLLAEEDENDEENKGEIDGDTESFEGFNGSGRTVTLQMLLAANVLQPGRAAMTIEYLGQKFVGDLLPDGKIKSHETETVFLSPSAWAMHCKRIINPEKKSGCGWASVKYKGKKLDAYKATWMRKCAQQKDSPSEGDEPENEAEKKPATPPPQIKRIVLSHNTISNRNVMHDANSLIEAVTFTSVNKLQPFLLTVSSSTLLLADFHTHLTNHEVCGYLGGSWDVHSHTLAITKCYPCRNSRHDRHKGADVEMEIRKMLLKDQLILVGWYHSHTKFQSQPTLRDIDSQLDYQIKLRGPSDVTYTPCVGIIFSPYYEDNLSLENNITPFWVVPPPENRQMLEYGRPMYMEFATMPDDEISEDIRIEMQQCIDYYSQFRGELVDFKLPFKDTTILEKLKTSLYPKFPAQTDDKEFWNFICRLLRCDEEIEFIAPKLVKKIAVKEEIKLEVKEEIKEEIKEELQNQPDLKVLTLQEQLALPSGLNMNPTRLTSPLVAPTVNNTTPASSSPRDSPITIPSNSASPAKFEIPVRASPSPAKSDTSSSRTRNSPAPSPGKFSISDISRNSPSITPNKYEHVPVSSSSNDLMTATMASLAGQLSPNFWPSDLNAFFQQQQQKDYGSSSLNQLVAAAAKVGSSGKSSSLSEQNQYEKAAESYNASFNLPGTSKSLEQHVTPKSSKQESKSSKQSSSTSYKTKLMKELEDLKNDPIKISELMRSPEYAALLLQQAEALGATTLGTLGFGADFSFLGGGTSSSSLSKKSQQQQAPTVSPAVDYSNLLQASKLLGYDAYMQQAKSANDLNAFFQQQMGASMKKQHQQQQQSQQADYTALLQTYSKLFDATNPYATSGKSSVPPELSALLNSATGPTGSSSSGSSGNNSKKQKDTAPTDMLNQLLQSDKNADLNSLLYHHSKAAADLNALFVPPTTSSVSSASKIPDPAAYYSQLAQEKIQDYAALFQQHHGKYGIPDPLSKSTLAANNMFMSPSALLKLQQESLNAMMMKPPKSSGSSSSSSRARESSVSPAQERLTPTKSGRGGSIGGGDSPASLSSGMKYNFSAVDLAISSVPVSTPSPSPSDSSSSLRRPSDTPPVDLSRLYAEAAAAAAPSIPSQKKRMEFSSIADLAAPPPAKQAKTGRDDRVLNLSSND